MGGTPPMIREQMLRELRGFVGAGCLTDRLQQAIQVTHQLIELRKRLAHPVQRAYPLLEMLPRHWGGHLQETLDSLRVKGNAVSGNLFSAPYDGLGEKFTLTWVELESVRLAAL